MHLGKVAFAAVVVVVVIVVRIVVTVVVTTVAVSASSPIFTSVVIVVSLLEVARSPAALGSVSLLDAKHILFLCLFHDRIGQTKEFDMVSTNINLLQLVELLSVVVVIDDVGECKVHP